MWYPKGSGDSFVVNIPGSALLKPGSVPSDNVKS